MARTEKKKRVSPKEFSDAWLAEIDAGGSVEGVVKRLNNRITVQAAKARANGMKRKRDIDLGKFPRGGHAYDWGSLKTYVDGQRKGSNGHAKSRRKSPKKKSRRK